SLPLRDCARNHRVITCGRTAERGSVADQPTTIVRVRGAEGHEALTRTTLRGHVIDQLVPILHLQGPPCIDVTGNRYFIIAGVEGVYRVVCNRIEVGPIVCSVVSTRANLVREIVPG